MSLKNYSEKKHIHLTGKRKCFSVRVTTNINGHLKNCFIDDAIKRNDMEASHARNIIEVFYSIMGEFPELKEKEFPDIKYFIISKIKSNAPK